MNPLEIILILVGIIVIAISCILTNRQQGSENGISQRIIPDIDQLSEEEIKQMKDSINSLMAAVGEEAVVRTDDELSRISNEKIMAVNEFSDQILEKIKNNHDEVVFLYNMLNDKEKELKAVVREIDSSRKKVQEILEIRKENGKEQTVKKTAAPATAASAAALTEKAVKSEKSVKTVSSGDNKPVPVPADAPMINSLSTNNNAQILALYNKGKSVVEISKLLGLGQGEVKLVIDLFKGKK